MQNSKLTQTHNNLTLVFTGMVFLIVLILGLSTLSAKYFNDLRILGNTFEIQANEIYKTIETDRNFPKSFLIQQALENRKPFLKFRDEFGEGKRYTTSFFIIDPENQISFQNILEIPNFESINVERSRNTVFISKGFLFEIFDLKGKYNGSTLVLYKKIDYNLRELSTDVLLLLCITLLFGVLFYFLGYRFVGRALQPVQQNLQDMKDFIHNAGHELKTPLAVMRGNLQVMQAEQKLDLHLVAQSLSEVDMMNGLLESLQELSELGVLSEKKYLSLTQTIDTIATDYESLIQEKNIEFLGLVLPDLQVYANPHELHVLLSNIIKNAIKYTGKGGKVELKLKKNKLTITDNGIGIAPKDLDNIFERFFQGENARSFEGYGIGLSLAKKIADANSWKLSVSSELGIGTTFTICFS